MDESQQEKLIQDWLAVNPGSEQQARFYLEANGWDLNAALSNFYEEPPMSEGLSQPRQEDLILPPDPTRTAAPVVSAGPVHAPAPQTPSASVPRRRYGSGARIATLSSLSSTQDDNAGDDKDDAEEWYAGGERSGMAVQPPTQDQPNEGGSLVDRILRRAAEGGGAFGGPPGAEPEDEPQAARVFTGRGRKLGEPGAANDASADEYAPSDNSGDDDDDDDDIAVRELTFWRNGFSIGDGPLYSLEDPANRQNLDAILQGRAPLDILNVRPGQRVEMKIAVRRGEDYVSPTPEPAPAFSGHGRRLGGIAPALDGAPSGAASTNSAPTANPITLDPSQPTVQVQVRLADGTRLVARANPTHTIGDLRAFVLSQRPAAGQRAFTFKAIMPPKVLGDDSQTIAAAGIANAAVAQHFL